jgi:hypothetical protein
MHSLRLSNLDLNFVENLYFNILNKTPITTNQVELFEKLICKYEKQLKKQDLDLGKCKNLLWTSKIIESNKEFKKAYITINEDTIIFKSPFNKKFLNEFRAVSYNPFKWDKSKKEYTAKFNTHSFKILTQTVNKHFKDIIYCDNSKKIFDYLEEFKHIKFWEPTLIKVNNNFFIAATNPHIEKSLGNIDLNDSAITLSDLAEHSVVIDSSVTNQNKFLKFAGNFFNDCDIHDIDELIDYLKQLKCDCIYYSMRLGSTKPLQELKSKLYKVTNNHINFSEIAINQQKIICKYPVMIQFSTVTSYEKIKKFNIKKVVKIKNSELIELRKQ